MRYERWDPGDPGQLAVIRKHQKYCLWTIALSLLSAVGIFALLHWSTLLESDSISRAVVAIQIGLILLSLVALFNYVGSKLTIWAGREYKKRKLEEDDEQKHL